MSTGRDLWWKKLLPFRGFLFSKLLGSHCPLVLTRTSSQQMLVSGLLWSELSLVKAWQIFLCKGSASGIRQCKKPSQMLLKMRRLRTILNNLEAIFETYKYFVCYAMYCLSCQSVMSTLVSLTHLSIGSLLHTFFSVYRVATRIFFWPGIVSVVGAGLLLLLILDFLTTVQSSLVQSDAAELYWLS